MLAPSSQYVCLHCRYHYGNKQIALRALRNYSTSSPRLTTRLSYYYVQPHHRSRDGSRKQQAVCPARGTMLQHNAYSAKATSGTIMLQPEQRDEVALFAQVGRQLQKAWHELSPDGNQNIKFEEVLEASGIKKTSNQPQIQRVASKIEELYAEKPHFQVNRDLATLIEGNHLNGRTRKNSTLHTVLNRLGIVDESPKGTRALTANSSERTAAAVVQPPISRRKVAPSSKTVSKKGKVRMVAAMEKTKNKQATAEAPVTLRFINATPPVKETETPVKAKSEILRFINATPPVKGIETPIRAKSEIPGKAPSTERVAILDQTSLKVARVDQFQLDPIDMEMPKVPRLSFDLSRVLFNPGVYQLQDPRSRVWNFDPYLGKIMPVSEFNYDALNKYITSSEDDHLREVALQHRNRYIGSTSSLSSTLSHFHFLLSAFRELTMHNMSRGFGEDFKSFTKLQRGPTAIFLRWRDGTYAVDADKEFDSANILMSLGRSMEKLLTLEKAEFEQYRKTHDPPKNSQAESQERESYHYTKLGQFLLRSQLDCYDPRIPGTGMFDLKTRAVAGVRMMLSNHEEGQGYQIKGRFGTWESYEREYYDMMRAAFLKYSLQVRMGRMDGIFVAYHNVARIFGFQYISLPEMDLALHGQTDKALGDREFRLSFKMLNDIFDEATAAYPETSVRFHFEAREATATTPVHMYIFAEPVTEDEIHEIQTTKKSEIEAYEQRIFNPQATQEADKKEGSDKQSEGADAQSTSIRQSNAADVAFLENLMGVDYSQETISASNDSSSTSSDTTSNRSTTSEAIPDKPVLAWRLAIRNIVNGHPVVRPVRLSEQDTWDVEYNLTRFSEALGRRNYTLCKNRRKACLEFPQDEDTAAGYYIQQLVAMSRDGAQWRRRMDDFDAQREQVVLYGDGINQSI